MAVNSVGQAHVTEPQTTLAANSRTQNGASKTAATTAAPQQAHANGAQGTQGVTAGENHGGQEQGYQRQQPQSESKGTRVNIYA